MGITLAGSVPPCFLGDAAPVDCESWGAAARGFFGFAADAGDFGLRLAPFLGIFRGGFSVVFAWSSHRTGWSVLVAGPLAKSGGL